MKTILISLLLTLSVLAQVTSIHEVTTAAGTTSAQELEISNSGTQPVDWKLTTSPGSWIQLDSQSVTVAPGATQKLPFKVTVPADAPKGEKEGWLYLESAGKRTQVRISTFVGTHEDKEAAWEIESAEGSGQLKTKKVLRDNQLYLQLTLVNSGTLYLKPRFNWSLETTKGEVLQKEPELREAKPVGPGSTTVLEMRLVPIKKKAIYRFKCRVEEARDLLPPMEQSVEVQLP